MKEHPTDTQLSEKKSGSLLRWPGLTYGVLPLTIIVLVVIASLIAYSLATANLEGTRSRAIDRKLSENSISVSSYFDSYAHLLWGSTGLLESGTTDRQSWLQFISVYDIRENFSGAEGLAVTIGNNTRDAKIAYVAPDEPSAQRWVGNGLSTDPSVHAALVQAARSDQTMLTGAYSNISTPKENDSDSTGGFYMVAPFYNTSMPPASADSRQKALGGFTVAIFRGDMFFKQAFKGIDLSHTKISVYLGDPTAKNLMFEQGITTDRDVRSVKQTLTEYGQTFTIIYRMDTAYIVAWFSNYFPALLLFGCLFFGGLFAVIVGFMLRSRYSRLIYEKERDVEFAKDELLSLASHQLRTPATGVKQYLGMILQGFAGPVSEKQRDYLERAYASNNRQLGVINDILHLAKLETGRIVLAERKFDLARMVRDVVDEQRESAERGELTLILEAPSKGLIIGDSHMLRMVIENIVSNAIKYTPPGGTVTIRLTRRASRWLLMVKDTGVGIAKADFPKLFQQFSRINNPRTEVVTGTGVGLYLAYHLTVLHGGSIGIASRRGKGSTFTVRLPRKI